MTDIRYILLVLIGIVFFHTSNPFVSHSQTLNSLPDVPRGSTKEKNQNKAIPNCRHTALCTQGCGWAHLSDEPEARKDLMRPPGGAWVLGTITHLLTWRAEPLFLYNRKREEQEKQDLLIQKFDRIPAIIWPLLQRKRRFWSDFL